jgi:peptide/nickel transport system ATP-binding protein
VVRQIADTVSVLNGGRLVDSGPVDAVFSDPQSAYTQELIDAIPGKKHPQIAIRPSPTIGVI